MIDRIMVYFGNVACFVGSISRDMPRGNYKARTMLNTEMHVVTVGENTNTKMNEYLTKANAAIKLGANFFSGMGED